ncbi:hypothetical protein F511_31927 [Dorcoceras hygrometricum]|uniref:CCHC-type domain-containing protein n=1 Tax=Dorcoceras hygrometricum TaxID=472368 RepID=A0A2Z7B194_9LAMI|nr:hypothetical protein F511_31927 [Dorcoceras hygrometricum]
MLTWISVVGVLARIQLLRETNCCERPTVVSDQLLTSAVERSHALRLLVCESAIGSEVTDLCCLDFVVAAVCGNCSSGAGEVRMLSLYYGCNWHGYYDVCCVCIACCLYAVQLLHCIHTINSISAAVAVLCCCSIFLPVCDGERQYRTLISLLVFQVIPLAVALTQLEMPQEIDRVSQLCIVFVCTGITLGGMSRGAQGGRPAVQGAQSSQSSQSSHQPPKQLQQQLAQHSSSSGSRAEICGFCGGKNPSTQCVGVQGSCNICGQYGHFAMVCLSAGSQQAAAPPQGRGGSSRGRTP